jgi:hypothetical protein
MALPAAISADNPSAVIFALELRLPVTLTIRPFVQSTRVVHACHILL